MSTINNPPVFNNGKRYNIRTHDNRLLKLEKGNSFSVKAANFDQSSVQFFIERTFNPANTQQEVFRIIPISQQSKYVAVSGQKVVLKGSSEVADNSHEFVVIEPNGGFLKLQSILSPSNAPTFISTDQNGAVFMAGDTPNDPRRAWFRLVEVTGNIVNGIGVSRADVVTGNPDRLIEFEKVVVSEE